MSILTEKHETYYQAEKVIEDAIKSMTDEDLKFAYWLHYESNWGLFETMISQEYRRRESEKTEEQ